MRLSLLYAHKVDRDRNKDSVSSPPSVLPAQLASSPSRQYVGGWWGPEAARGNPINPNFATLPQPVMYLPD